jgi:rhamnosyl/mannosyltransferase
MHILHFYKKSLPESFGGVEQMIDQIATGAVNRGVSTDVLSLTTNNTQDVIKFNGYSVHTAKLNFQIASTGFSYSAYLKFSQLMNRADLIHYHYPWPFMDLVHFASRIRKPTLVTYHSDIVRQKNLQFFYQPLRDKFLESVDRIVSTSPNYFLTSNVLKRYSRKVSVIPIGLDKTSYPHPGTEVLNYWRKRIGIKFFLFIGVLRYYKGLDILIKASQGVNFPIVIVGTGPLEKELKEQAYKLQLNNIIFTGELSEKDKIALLSICYAVILPSNLRTEAFGISLLEGAMFGKPMICCEIGTGTTFINIANNTGVVIPPSNPLALQQAMIFLWENPDLAREYGKSAETRYWKYFEGKKMVDSYISLYRNLID